MRILSFLSRGPLRGGTAIATAAAVVTSGLVTQRRPQFQALCSAAAPQPQPAAAVGSGSLGPVRVVSYNVLSQALCRAEHFTASAPEDLDPDIRLNRVMAQLEPHMARESVICLQEVSATWLGTLTPFFESRGYTLSSGLYGSSFSDYMGVALAWPTRRFASEQVDVKRASDAKAWPKPPADPPRGPLRAVLARSWSLMRRLFYEPLVKRPAPPFDSWAEARKRANILLSARLRCKASGARFCVSTYHMPCLFGSDEKVQARIARCGWDTPARRVGPSVAQVMVIHAALAAQRAAAFAAGLPYVLAGDFNIQPDSSPYELLTTGSIRADHPQQPPTRAHDTWTPTPPAPLTSAYVTALGAEPEFTNFAMTAWQSAGDPFVGTLDYIFLSDGWKTKEVKPLPSLQHTLPLKSYPCATEPSDHLLIWADLELV